MIEINIAVIFLFVILISSLGSNLALLITDWMNRRYSYFEKELEVRKLEAMANMNEADRRLLLESMPKWVDPNDEEEVARYVAARKEVSKAGK